MSSRVFLYAACVCAVLAAVPAQAQTVGGKIRVVPQPAAPAPTAAIANRPLPGAPSASGLASPFPPSASAPGVAAVPGTSAMGTVPSGAAPSDINSGLGDPGSTPQAPDTTVMGAGPYGSRGIARAGGLGPLTALDIARSFLQADGNRDGELSRAEATRLSILPLTFEEMDANHDDRLTRSEYEDAVR